MANPFSYQVTPRFSDTDAYGVVHHSNYFRWMEEARIAFTASVLGFTMSEFKQRQIRFPVTESHCYYKHPILYGDPLVIQLWVRMSSAPKWTFIYHIMHDETKRIHAKASTTHVYVNEEGKLLLTHPDWFWKRVSEVAAKHPGLYLEST